MQAARVLSNWLRSGPSASADRGRRWALGALRWLAVAAVVLAPSARCEVTLVSMVTFESVQFTACKEGFVVEATNTGVLPLADVVEAMTGDPDGDGVPSLLDACPRNPYCSTRLDATTDADGDGRPAWGDRDDADPSVVDAGDPDIDQFPSQSSLTRGFLEFPDVAALGDAFLAENAVQHLYPATDLIDAAATAGVDAATILRWRQEFGGN